LRCSVGTICVTLFPVPLADPDNPLAIEILQEAAVSYFAACRKMVDALEALKAFDREAASSTEDRARITRRPEIVDEAIERVYFVLIQREAMQLSCLEAFFEGYEIPAEVRTRLGPRRNRI
jgi:hypothetical protein